MERTGASASAVAFLFVMILLSPLWVHALAQQEGEQCEVMVRQAMESLLSDQYRQALHYVERAFGLPGASEECKAYCVETQSCAYLRMGERARAIEALARLLEENPNAPYDGRMFPPAMNRLFRAVRDSVAKSGTMDIGTIAVLDFTVLNPAKYKYGDYDYEALGKALQMIVTTDLVESTNLTVVDRTNMKDVLAELELTSNRDLLNKENAIRLGQLLNAHAFVDGQIVIVDRDKVRVDVQVVHTATTRVLARHYEGPFSGDPMDLLKLERGVLASVVDALNEFRSEVRDLGKIEPDPVYFDRLEKTRRANKKYVESWLVQGEALALEDKGDLKGAIRKWKKVLELDPENKVAKARIWALKAELEG